MTFVAGGNAGCSLGREILMTSRQIEGRAHG
jgi:hypothetical protein